MSAKPGTSEPVSGEPLFSPLRWGGDFLELLDQTRLPAEEVWLECREPAQVADAIRRLAVRGAPAIGVAAAYGLVLAVRGGADRAAFERAWELLAGTRPTAVNLRWALERGRALFVSLGDSPPERRAERFLAWAHELHRQDVEANRQIGDHGARLFRAGDRVLTHCNTGALATAGFGTALGVIQASFSAGRLASVWVDETRPLLQGARLTTWELKRLGIPHKLVTDSSAGALMARGMVDRIVLGADRIARNGDTANKIGTYSLAVLARHHGVPFYVAAPRSTIDSATPSGAQIPIEERAADEVTRLYAAGIAPPGTEVLNYAFDVTPAELITAIITEVGVLEPPFEDSIGRALEVSEPNR